ncbi:MAG: hypothetical protein GF311_10490 [Candidatus Lokiarchaeota archaeon]|nr:hypothetical protein [Candidatus Lokiarchaeota archaeon]
MTTHEDIIELTRQMAKRFEKMQKAMDKRFDAMDKRFDEGTTILGHIQQHLGKPFEQFGRNVLSKLLKTEGYEKVSLEAQKIKDPDSYVAEGSTEIEIDGFSIEPPVVVEITSI